MQHIVYIGLGSNQGDDYANLQRALALLEEDTQISVVRVSRFIHTEPMGPPQRRFLNAAARIDTHLSAHELLVRLHQIETAVGRDRSVEERWGPRTCDLDILLVDDLVIDTPELTVPHPGIQERLFVLRPLAEIAGRVMHPLLGRTIAQLLEELERQS